MTAIAIATLACLPAAIFVADNLNRDALDLDAARRRIIAGADLYGTGRAGMPQFVVVSPCCQTDGTGMCAFAASVGDL